MTSNHSTRQQLQNRDAAKELMNQESATMAKTEPETFYTVAQIAEYLGVSERTVRRWIRDRKLTADRLGRAVRIAGSSLGAFLAARWGQSANG